MLKLETHPRTLQTRQPRQELTSPAISAERVRELLLRAAYALHATRVVARRGQEDGEQG